MKRTFVIIGLVSLSFALPPTFAQDQQPPQQQPEIDPAAAEAAMQAAATALEAAAAERAALEAQMADNQPGGPATQPVAQADEQPETNPQPSATPTSRPSQRNRLQFKRRTTTRPAVAARTPPKPVHTLQTDYAVLLGRSIFMKGPQTVIDTGPGGKGPTTGPAEVVSPERSLVFNGLTESDSTTALVEDTVAHKINKLHVGDSIAAGKVTRIDFDSLDYTVNGKTTKVAIGQNLEGTTAAPTSGPATFGTSGGTSGTSSGGGGGGDSILERMRQRRMQGK
jgi:hypothetical protein